MTINALKDTLDVRLGFILPWDTPYFLPMLLDEYIITTMPELAVLLGESPCSRRIARIHPEAGICEHELAYACSQHAVGFEDGKLGLEFLRACYQDYGISPAMAQKHQHRCHPKEKQNSRVGVSACTRVKQQIERNKEVCFYIPPIVDCTIQYSRWEDLRPLLKSAGFRGDENLEQGTCDKRLSGDTYIDNRFRGMGGSKVKITAAKE
ncbi:unnamed protein product [Aureobasidium mustum]|uniref:Uncharacterized protein n=1 Tax=Aureobasidium mustum TaxID=2773714 RepID=A0A9N8JZP5_9PEZI|nr:unnamed protein product [Aureobasidium mustum]